MKELRMLAVAFFGVIALGAIATSPAMAVTDVCYTASGKEGLFDKRSSVSPDGCEEELFVNDGEFELWELLLALWLIGGVNVLEPILTNSEGELELVALNAGNLGITVRVLCSVILDGWIGSESLDFTSELLTLGLVGVSTTILSGAPLLCTNIANCTEPEVWAAKLGWESEVELMTSETLGMFYVDLISKPAWYLQCLLLGITSAETCEAAEGAAKLTNEVGGKVDFAFSEEFQILAGGKLGNCSMGGTEKSEVNGLLLMSAEAGAVTVSSE